MIAARKGLLDARAGPKEERTAMKMYPLVSILSEFIREDRDEINRRCESRDEDIDL